MRPRNFPHLAILVACLTLALGAVLWSRSGREPQASIPATLSPLEPAPSATAAKPLYGGPVIPLRDDGEPPPEATRPARPATPPPRVLSDAELLVKGGVLPPVQKSAPAAPAPAALPAPSAPAVALPGAPAVSAPVVSSPSAPAANRLHSIKAEDWQHHADQLVKALRAEKGMEIDHAQMMDFLQGREAYGWPESYRNWIGDELMIVLCQDLPERAFADLRTIQENAAAPAALRDYSVQHIADLVATKVIAPSGAAYVWQVLAQNDPATLSTALITLHHLSVDQPEVVSASRVAAAAQGLLHSPDLRTQITARAILKK